MHLNKASDFALRILLLLGKREDPVSIDEIATTLNISKSNVMKIVAKLSANKIVKTQRGPRGGVVLHQSPRRVGIGQIVRLIEIDLGVVDCLSAGPCSCVYLPRCALKPVMAEATQAFLSVLDDYTLADLLPRTCAPKPVELRLN